MNIELLKEIASFLPTDFVVAQDKISLQRADGLNLWFHSRYNTPDKITVKYGNSEKSYVTVYENHNKLDYPSINVSADKEASKIAKDIVRRLLPDAEKVHKLVLEKVVAENAFVDGKTKTINDLASICNTAPNRCRHNQYDLTGEVSPYEGIKQFSNCGYGEFKVNSENSVSLKLESMSKNVALKVAVALREIFEREYIKQS
jgi:hypothetical protein